MHRFCLVERPDIRYIKHPDGLSLHQYMRLQTMQSSVAEQMQYAKKMHVQCVLCSTPQYCLYRRMYNFPNMYTLFT